MSDLLFCINCGFDEGNKHGDCTRCGRELVRLQASHQPVTGIEKWIREQESVSA